MSRPTSILTLAASLLFSEACLPAKVDRTPEIIIPEVDQSSPEYQQYYLEIETQLVENREKLRQFCLENSRKVDNCYRSAPVLFLPLLENQPSDSLEADKISDLYYYQLSVQNQCQNLLDRSCRKFTPKK